MTPTVLLALDTSTEFCSVALLIADPAATAAAATHGSTPHYSAGAVHVWFSHELTGSVSSTRLLPAIRELFDTASLKLPDCSAVAFGAGPGSFTGLRTATGVAQGLAFGLGVPVVPVGTLLVCAEFARLHEPSATRVLAALDARMNEVYWADFRWDRAAGEWGTVQAASLDLPEAIVLPDEPFTLAGNAAAAFGERLPVPAAPACRIDFDALPHALPVALAGLRALRAGRTVAPDQAAPEYVRNKVAQTTAERMDARAAKAAAANCGCGRSGQSHRLRRAGRSHNGAPTVNGVLMADRYLSSMTESDLDEVAAIEKLAYEFPWTLGNFQDSLCNGYFGVCLRHVTGTLLGYCVLMPVVDEMHLLNLCVAPQAQHAGAGLTLLREAVRISRHQKLDGVLLEVRPSNPRAIQLYERFGFATIGRRKNYYPARHRSREDALVMRLTFSKEAVDGAA